MCLTSAGNNGSFRWLIDSRNETVRDRRAATMAADTDGRRRITWRIKWAKRTGGTGREKKKERKKKRKPSPLLKNKSDERSRKKGNKRTENGRPTAGLEQHAGTGAGTQQVISKSDADATHTHTLPPNTSSAFCIEHGVGEFSGLIGSAFAPVRIRTNDEWRSREKDARFETDNHRETRNTEGKKTVESINQAHLHPTESKRRMMNGRHPNKSRPN